MNAYDVIIAGSGAAGMMAAAVAARHGNNVLLLEKLSRPGAKLKATGGGRCNLTNTLDNATFMARFGREGRFMTPALEAFGHRELIAFFHGIGVDTHAPDGFRVFPVTHSAETILSALEKELERLGVEVRCRQKVIAIEHDGGRVTGVQTETERFSAPHVILATGGLGYPQLGAEGDGYALARQAGHTVTELYPAMMPLKTKETWVQHCRADTIPKVTIRVDLKKAKKLRAEGDLIFTKTGIRGPAVLDFAREVTPLLERYGEVPLLINMTGGMSEDDLLHHFKAVQAERPDATTLVLVQTLLPEALSLQLCILAHADPETRFTKLDGPVRNDLLKLLARTPLTVTGHEGFKMAMITRGGVSLKEIRPETMESRLLSGLFFCGELMNLDGPCGGYNLQWSFASGYVAGHLGEKVAQHRVTE